MPPKTGIVLSNNGFQQHATCNMKTAREYALKSPVYPPGKYLLYDSNLGSTLREFMGELWYTSLPLSLTLQLAFKLKTEGGNKSADKIPLHKSYLLLFRLPLSILFHNTYLGTKPILRPLFSGRQNEPYLKVVARKSSPKEVIIRPETIPMIPSTRL